MTRKFFKLRLGSLALGVFLTALSALLGPAQAQIAPDPKDYPGALPIMLKPGSLLFNSPKHPVGLRDWSQWWTFKFGANWRRPNGPCSSLAGLNDHPVVHVAYTDALAYAKWAGKDLPTEAGWEFVGRGRLDGTEFAWGYLGNPG